MKTAINGVEVKVKLTRSADGGCDLVICRPGQDASSAGWYVCGITGTGKLARYESIEEGYGLVLDEKQQIELLADNSLSLLKETLSYELRELAAEAAETCTHLGALADSIK